MRAAWVTLLGALAAGGPAAAEPPGGPADRMVEVPAGWFTLGDDLGGDSGPAHRVLLDRFSIDRREVTVEEYARTAGAAGLPVPAQPPWSGPDHPVVNVTWQEALDHCRRLGKTLPTEAQWEKAARAGGEGTLYPWGDDPSRDHANIEGREGRDRWDKSAPVGSLAANALGLFDVVGNAAEWVLDWYAPDYYAASPAQDPQGPAQGKRRVLRGGTWYDCPTRAEVSARSSAAPDKRHYGFGFRCASASRGTKGGTR